MSRPPTLARPARGTPAETKTRLVDAAARELEQHGYFGTDTNRIAVAAGYAPGTFYKHFPDKRAIFLAVYDQWVNVEWDGIAALVAKGSPPRVLATEIVGLLVAHHRAWQGFRASLRVLVLQDADVRDFHRQKRAWQLETLVRLGGRKRFSRMKKRKAALLMLTIERVCDAIADGEITSLSLSEADARAHLVAEVEGFLAVG